MEDIGLTLDAVMRDLLKSNELPQFLHDRGWQLVGPMPSPPEDVRFDVPFFPAMMGRMVRKENFINKIRALRYTYKDRQKRTDL
jgi:hypothetical protein